MLGMATMDDTETARATAERLNIAGQLAFIVGADDGHGEKPGPGMVLAFCAACGLDPAEVIVVGDTPADLLMARSAGCASGSFGTVFGIPVGLYGSAAGRGV